MKHAKSNGELNAANEEKSGVSRRQVLARSAVAAGVVWTAPVIKTASAYALTASGTERPCTQFYIAELTLDQSSFPEYPYGFYPPEKKGLESSSQSSSTQALTVSPAMIVARRIAAWTRDNPSVPLLEPDVYPLITQTGSGGWAVLLPEVTGPNEGGRQARFIMGYSYQETNYAYGFVDPNPSNPMLKGRRLLFPSPVVSAPPTSPETATSNSNTSTTTPTTTPPLDLPEQTPARRSRRFAYLFGPENDGQPVLEAPISGVVLIYCQP